MEERDAVSTLMFLVFVFNVSSAETGLVHRSSAVFPLNMQHLEKGRQGPGNLLTCRFASKNQRVLINPSIVPHMSISTKGYRGEINVRINSKWASLLFVTNYRFVFVFNEGELGGY